MNSRSYLDNFFNDFDKKSLEKKIKKMFKYNIIMKKYGRKDLFPKSLEANLL